MTAKKYLPNYTYEDYEMWEGKWELIGGIPYAMSPAPNLKHQFINSNLLSAFIFALAECETCKALMPVDWKIDSNTVIQPDLLIICEKLEGQYLENPPRLVVEILSPSTAQKDRNLKFHLYESQKVKYYLIVDPTEEKIEIYLFENEKYELAKVIDRQEVTHDFEMEECAFVLDFSKIW